MALTAFMRVLSETELITTVRADSAGTSDWHVGEDMDPRARSVLHTRSYKWEPHVARQITEADRSADLLIALDELVEASLIKRFFDPARVKLLSAFDTENRASTSVRDPYTGSIDDFAFVMDQIESLVRNVIPYLRKTGVST